MKNKVILDALIPREDFETQDQNLGNTGQSITSISIHNLKINDPFYLTLRKPDFQRETNEWEADRVCALIESFVNGDLIPAIILWKAQNTYTFVIDGSHRLSALAAWINDDYGDGSISKNFFDNVLTESHKNLARKTRVLVKKRIGLYSDYVRALSNEEGIVSSIIEKSKNLSTLAIQLQWVQGPAEKAEASFYKINRQAVIINNTELTLIESRKKPIGIAARAIIRGGTGHKYWSKFSKENQEKIQDIASIINKLLFQPEVSSTIKSLDLPIAGKVNSSQALPLVLDFICLANNIKKDDISAPNDNTGEKTIKLLTNCKKVAERINSSSSGSFGLHPAVYFYSLQGQYKIASFYGTILFINELINDKSLQNDFIKVRSKFEKFILKSDYYMQQISRKYRGALPAAPYMKDFYIFVIKQLKEKKDITKNDFSNSNFSYLYQKQNFDEVDEDFTPEIKSETFLKEAIRKSLKCKICNGYINKEAITFDHKQRKADGGKGYSKNAQISHPFCNTTYKN